MNLGNRSSIDDMLTFFPNQIRNLLFLSFALFIVSLVINQNLGWNNGIVDLFRGLPHFDKVGHFVLMGALNFFAILAIAPRLKMPRLNATLWTSTVVTVVVALEELSQGWIASRSLSALDFLASLLGVIAFGFAGHFLVRPKS